MFVTEIHLKSALTLPDNRQTGLFGSEVAFAPVEDLARLFGSFFLEYFVNLIGVCCRHGLCASVQTLSQGLLLCIC